MSSVEAKLSSKFPRNVIFSLSYSFHIISVTSEVIFVSNHFDKDVIWLFSQNSPFYLSWGRRVMMMMERGMMRAFCSFQLLAALVKLDKVAADPALAGLMP